MGKIQTYTGRMVDPLDIKEEDLDIVDIAHALSNKCRFGGHVLFYYSVAQHSVLVSNLTPKPLAWWGLIHDIAEAYLPDICRPIKEAIRCKLPSSISLTMPALESRILRVVCERYGLEWPEPHDLERYDLVALATERRDLMRPMTQTWGCLDKIEPNSQTIIPHPPALAKAEFLTRFQELFPDERVVMPS